MLREAAERYVFGVNTTMENEILSIDGGFVQRLASVNWRLKSHIPTSEYFNGIPTPKTVVFVDASPELCLQRQDERGGRIVDKSWTKNDFSAQEKFSQSCKKVSEDLEQSGTKVINIDGGNNLGENISKIINALGI